MGCRRRKRAGRSSRRRARLALWGVARAWLIVASRELGAAGCRRATWQYCRYCLAVLPPARALTPRPRQALAGITTAVVCDDSCRAWRAPYLCRPRSIARAQWLMPADHCGLSRGLRGRNTVRRAEVTGEGRRSLSTERRYHPAVEASIASASRLFRLRMPADTSVMISATGSGSRNVIA